MWKIISDLPNVEKISIFINLHCALFVLYGLRVCYKTLKPKKFLKGLRTTVLDKQ